METYLDTLKNFILNKFSSNDKDKIDISKTFSSQNINIIHILKNVLNYPETFPDHILLTPLGHKYNELEFFTANMDSSINSDNHTKSLFEHFSSTQTHLGSMILQNLLINPTIDIKLLKQRQDYIK